MTESQEQTLINQIVDGEETAHEWREFVVAADARPAAWKELAQIQRDHAALARGLNSRCAVADAVPLPRFDVDIVTHATPQYLKFNRFGAFTGWAVAALVAIVASIQYASVTNTLPQTPSDSKGVQQAGFFNSAAEAFQAYLEKGQETGEVVGEMPDRLLIETKPALSGNGIEVIYVRQVMERTIVPDLYQVSGQDETGRPTLVRYERPIANSM